MDVVELVKKAKKGNQEALLQLIMAKKDELYRLSYSYMGNSYDAMDAMEEMIVKLYENINQLKKEEAFYSWCKTILVNSCKAILRKKKKVVLVEDWNEHIEIENKAATTNPYQIQEQRFDIQQQLNELNPHQAEAISLKYIHDLDYQTISEITKVSIGTVKSRVFQGLKRLKHQMGGNGDE